MTKTTLKKKDMPATREYSAFLDAVKADIIQSQLRTMQTLNKELVMLYWRIGRNLSEKSQKEGWGSKVIETLARDIKIAFPDLKGFSPRNLVYMKTFAEAYPEVNYAAAAA
jgi:predicted nuclease of restriction endonuclease-like (RecB) superfamily